MQNSALRKQEGRQTGLPLSSPSFSGRCRVRFAIGACFCLCLLFHATCVAGQGRLLPRSIRPFPNAARAARAPQDPVALALLRRMVRPDADYVGEQVTEVTTERGERVSRQRIEGDSRGRVLRQFLEPPSLAGDIMLIAPGQYRYYHKHSNVLDIALWPTAGNEREQHVLAAIRRGRVSVSKVGEEMVAGRNAAIVLLRPAGAPNQPQMKCWIDTETGIQLKNERLSANGTLVSRSCMTSITIGPAANVRLSDFNPSSFRVAQQNPLFPPASPYNSVQEARPRLPFTPLEPTALPPGFRLSGIWVFPGAGGVGNRSASVLLRYSDGIANFSLYERYAPPNAPQTRTSPNAYRRTIQRWHVPTSNGSLVIVYIGHLPSEQAQAVRESLR